MDFRRALAISWCTAHTRKRLGPDPIAHWKQRCSSHKSSRSEILFKTFKIHKRRRSWRRTNAWYRWCICISKHSLTESDESTPRKEARFEKQTKRRCWCSELVPRRSQYFCCNQRSRCHFTKISSKKLATKQLCPWRKSVFIMEKGKLRWRLL